jgi:hypothetical protein
VEERLQHHSRLVGESSRTRNDSSGSRGEDVSGHDADLASSVDSRGDDSRAIGSYETRLGLAAKDLGDLGEAKEVVSLGSGAWPPASASTYPNLIGLGNSLSNADDERNLSLDGLNDGVGGEGRGNVDDGSFRLGLVVGL